LNNFTRHPKRIDVVGFFISRTENIIDFYVPHPVAQKTSYMVLKVSCNHNKSFKTVLVQVG